MKVHELKTIPPFLNDVQYGGKRFDLRKNDRNFHVGDLLVLREYYPESDTYTGDDCAVRIEYILTEFKGLESGYCILGISEPI